MWYVLVDEKVVLTEGSILERLRRGYDVVLDDYISSAALVYDEKGREKLREIYKGYIDIAVAKQLPIMIMTSTRRANKERIALSSFRDKDVIGDNVAFLKSIREEYPLYKDKIYIGGILGCKGDAYSGEEALSEEEAYSYHRWQVQKFKEAGVDYVFACIMPVLTETVGMAKAMSESGLPYIISFMIRKNGKLLDGTSIHEAIEVIDRIECKPIGYVVNCIHPKVLKEALEAIENQTDLVRERFIGIQANTSSMSPEELNESPTLHEESLEELVGGMMELYEMYGFKILGGCCGTTEQHINALANCIIEKI